ncbi:peptidoglycan amidohydrolase family protein [Limosilactobacillus frumenti]|uniref:peptidoglycan amidohydrolase family protein n=2 Tax=Limosilactobacillus frumenti TaxID=104955 RepID=UPI00070D9035|nr:peptidoglycan amidohydrolase family protein [Limosilactobacillus frumenti]MBA2914640.1 KxYKxGKxW signal peptide domain-containing protein [Limosilactobacillus frumenti]QFG72940.1 hypothetical protein LF145_06250 [Limosilactobacillus frumenti]
MKQHYKIYKSGKLWITACILTLGLLSFTGTANAQTENMETSTPQNEQRTQPVNKAQHVTSINGYTEKNGQWQSSDGQLANGWQTDQNNWYYFQDGQNSSSWKWINNNWYYMNPDSHIMETGLQNINNATYYLNEQHDGTYGAMKTGWQNVNNNWYYFANNGSARTGWQWLDHNWYYFDPTTSIMQAGLKQINNKGYYLNDQHNGAFGAMMNGWQNINGKWYGFGGPSDGSALTGWHYINKNWYYFNNNGEARTGFQTINGHQYYFDPTNAWALRGWQSLNNDWYYFDPSNVWALSGWQNLNGWFYFSPESYKSLNGLQTINNHLYYLNDQHDGTFGMMKTGWQNVNGNWYYFNSNGDALSGWQTITGYHYYLNPANYQMMTGIQKLDNNYYFFGPSGNQETGLVYNSTTGLLQYYDPSTGTRQISAMLNGQTLTFNSTTGDLDTTNITNGLVLLGNNRYFFLKNSNRFDANDWQKINGSWYYFGSNAAATTGWYKSAAGNWYFFNPDGTARTGWQSINGHWYLFDALNANAITGWYKSNAGFWYYFDPTNAWADTGWTFVNHNWYYMDPTNANMYTGGHWINGHWVNLQSNGAFVGFSQRVINWFLAREGKLTYSMYGSRTGADGTADCSGSMTQAVWSAGGRTPAHTYSTLDLGRYLLQNGYYIAGYGRGVQNVQYGDIVIWGTPGASAGGVGHTVVISTAGPDPMCISTCGYYWSENPYSHYGAAGKAVQEFNYQWYWNEDDRPYQMVYRPNFYWA